MVQVFHSFLDILKSFVYGIGTAWDWLTTPWFTWGIGEDAVSVYPLMIFSLTGLLVVAAVMLIKFLNPAS